MIVNHKIRLLVSRLIGESSWCWLWSLQFGKWKEKFDNYEIVLELFYVREKDYFGH